MEESSIPNERFGSSTTGSVKASPSWHIGNVPVTSRVPEILERSRGKKVLHLGCADVPYTMERGRDLLHWQLSTVVDPEALWGLDNDPEGVRLMRELGFDRILQGDCESLAPALTRERFDLIIAGEVIEHLLNPGLFLDSVRKIMHEDSELLLTTPNATSGKSIAHTLVRREKMHPDHNFLFSYRTLTHLLESSGLCVSEMKYYQERVASGIGRWRDSLIALFTLWSPTLSDGLVARAKVPELPDPEPTDRSGSRAS